MKNKKHKSENYLKKVVIVGDNGSGKSWLKAKIEEGDNLTDDYFQVISHHGRPIIPQEVIVDEQKVILAFWDIVAYDEDYARLRPLSYPLADVVLFVYSVDNPDSLEHVHSKWLPEIKKYIPYVHYLLIATKVDLLQDISIDKIFVNYEKGLEMSKIIEADGFIQCSARSGVGIEQVIKESARLCLTSIKEQFYKQKKCAIL